MPSAVPTITPSRLLILAWVILWITAVPLFHTHLPDISDGPASLQGGLAHTVFSPDLPGEYSRFSHLTHQDHFAQVSIRVSNSPELDFVLSTTEDSKSRKMGLPSALGVLCCLSNRPLLLISAIESGAILGRLLALGTPRDPRAPPSAVSS
jgi:hypothetical protein